VSENVGDRLRAIRTRFGLSQRALAKRAGVPSSTVSLVEAGRTSPSIGSLKRLLDAVEVSLAEFFSFDLPESGQVFFRHDELAEISSGPISFKQVGGPRPNARIQIMHETYAPGTDTGKVLYSHEGEEGGLILSGRLEVTVGDHKRVLKAGEAYLFPSTEPHRFRNVGTEPCVVISACSPPTF
jgi:transcriptional regulator with XRE-family HTH domain